MLTGCGSDLQSLDGVVTLDGEPASAGISLRFVPVNGGSPSYAVTDADGKYVAAFTFKRDGIQVGEHRVHLMPGSGNGANRGADAGGGGRESMPSESDRNNYMNSGADQGTEELASAPSLPKAYFQEIMTITVESGHNTIDIPLLTEAGIE